MLTDRLLPRSILSKTESSVRIVTRQKKLRLDPRRVKLRKDKEEHKPANPKLVKADPKQIKARHRCHSPLPQRHYILNFSDTIVRKHSRALSSALSTDDNQTVQWCNSKERSIYILERSSGSTATQLKLCLLQARSVPFPL